MADYTPLAALVAGYLRQRQENAQIGREQGQRRDQMAFTVWRARQQQAAEAAQQQAAQQRFLLGLKAQEERQRAGFEQQDEAADASRTHQLALAELGNRNRQGAAREGAALRMLGDFPAFMGRVGDTLQGPAQTAAVAGQKDLIRSLAPDLPIPTTPVPGQAYEFTRQVPLQGPLLPGQARPTVPVPARGVNPFLTPSPQAQGQLLRNDATAAGLPFIRPRNEAEIAWLNQRPVQAAADRAYRETDAQNDYNLRVYGYQATAARQGQTQAVTGYRTRGQRLMQFKTDAQREAEGIGKQRGEVEKELTTWQGRMRNIDTLLRSGQLMLDGKRLGEDATDADRSAAHAQMLAGYRAALAQVRKLEPNLTDLTKKETAATARLERVRGQLQAHEKQGPPASAPLPTPPPFLPPPSAGPSYFRPGPSLYGNGMAGRVPPPGMRPYPVRPGRAF